MMAEAGMIAIAGQRGGLDRTTTIVFSIGALFVAFFQAPGSYVEQQNRREVLAHGQDAIAEVDYSTGLQAVAIRWIDASGKPRRGEARTRKQVSGLRFAGKQVPIKYVDDPKVPPVMLTEVADREHDNWFWL